MKFSLIGLSLVIAVATAGPIQRCVPDDPTSCGAKDLFQMIQLPALSQERDVSLMTQHHANLTKEFFVSMDYIIFNFLPEIIVFSYDEHQRPNIDSEKVNKKRPQSDLQQQGNVSKNTVEDVELNQHDTQIDSDDRTPSFLQVMKQLSFIDKVIPFLVLISMIIGVVIGVFAKDGVDKTLNNLEWHAAVEWELFPSLFKSASLWLQLVVSFLINWTISPFVMLALAWITLPDARMERYRRGVALVGVARCIAMVMIWNTMARGNNNLCAMNVIINSILQIILFSPYALLFVNILASASSSSPNLEINYQQVATIVAIYLCLPLAAGLLTRLIVKLTMTSSGENRFFNWINHLATIGLLYTIIVVFANQGKEVIDNIGKVFRTMVPLALYFIIMWSVSFTSFYSLHKRRSQQHKWIAKLSTGGYEQIVAQSFTASSNNFELAIAVSTAVFGADAPETLAATLDLQREIFPWFRAPPFLMKFSLALIALVAAVSAAPVKRSDGGSGEWANGATSNTAATSGSSKGSDGDLLRRARLTRGEHGGDATWANGATSNTAATSGSSENSDGDLLRRALLTRGEHGDSGEWANGATSNTAATSGSSKGSDGELLRRGVVKRDEWANGATSNSAATSGESEHSDHDLLRRSGGPGGSGTWNYGTTKSSHAGSGSYENKKGELLKRDDKGSSGTWNTGATKSTSAGSGTWEGKGGDLL
ncbi:SBF-domain-containing protein [Wallemia mellicola]|uniref:SBF-domain-containing protein n=1 Tax=Wallemia mellicola TaxID=1708541 RepID=A0A4T0MBU8_9BASI|nr:SBF-domain-containing protein [Wallemia mellicola]TIC56931.1 SBF-domain-containing protein [Wallemia mellicola]